MKALIAAVRLTACSTLALGAAALPLTVHSAAHAAVPAQEDMMIDGTRTMSYPATIARVQVDKENVIGVSAPTSRSLTISGIAQGDATLTVFDNDGVVMGETRINVVPAAYLARKADTPVAGEKIVAVDVQFAAVSTSTLKALGFNFSKLTGGLQGAVVGPSTLREYDFGTGGLSIDATAPIQSAFNLFLSAPKRGIGAVMSALSANGLSQMLAQPTLVARSGEEASFLAGGEFPIPIPQGSALGTTIVIEYKEFGVRLNVTPHVLGKDTIVLKLAPEVSELDYNNGVQLQGYVVPGIRRRSAETTVELTSGQSFVIAGLNYSTSSISKSKIPLLGDIPVLGAFFKRQENQKEQQELIIVATPRLVEPMRPEDVPPLPGTNIENLHPSFGQMIVGNDGVEDNIAQFGVERR